MNATIDTTGYKLDVQGDTAAVLLLEQGQWVEFTRQQPTANAVACVRKLINAANWSNIAWDMLDESADAAIAEALGLVATETLNGHEVETVEAGELRHGDRVVFTSGSHTFFTQVDGNAFRTYYQRTPGSEVIYGDWFLLIGGTRRYVRPGTTFKRAVDPAAVIRQEDQERRDLQARLRNIR